LTFIIMSSNKVNGQTNESIEADVALLSSLLSQDNVELSEDATNLAELLVGLNNADGVARGLEGKLDDVLANLDSLLAKLEEPKDGQAAPQEPQEKKDP